MMRMSLKENKRENIMIERKLLLGDEAIALGAIHAGISGVYAYPGTPSTEITEYIQGHASEVRSRWCTNEKTAMEAALGMSYAGKRALVCMKHVGMNVPHRFRELWPLSFMETWIFLLSMRCRPIVFRLKTVW